MNKLQKQIAENKAVQDELKRRAEALAEYARSIAPVKTGEYRDSIAVVPTPEGSGWRVEATDYKAVWIEFGTVDEPEKRVLGRAAQHIQGGGV